MNHQTVILDYLKQGKTLSQAEAIELCDCYRLSAVIQR
ncbi:helix-turn-helix domain-containing protein, partial [Acinetobacter baumannii]